MSVRSFDVFDTCLTRTFARPTDLFFELGRRAALRCGLEPDADAAHEFMARRVAAERAARRDCPDEDLSLAAIYERLDCGPPFGLDPGEAMAMELELEAESLRPVPATAARLAALRGRGERLVFISDMYLPGAFVREQLLRHGLARPEDPVYVSGDRGCCKWSGKLYQAALEELNLAPGQMRHVGDNPETDLRAPRRLGVRAERFGDADLTVYERAALDRCRDHDPAGSRLAAAARLARLAGPPPGVGDDARLAAWTELAADVVGPVLGAFTAWALRQAREQGVERLYFVSRDGQILWRMARAMVEEEARGNGSGRTPELRYLHGSRQAWFLPSLAHPERDGLEWLFVPGHSRRPRDVIAKLGLSPDDFAPDGPAGDDPFWSRPLGPNREGDLLALLSRGLGQQALQRSRLEARRTTLGYLSQEGLADPARLALVDVGWTLKAQAALRGLVAQLGGGGRLSGFYFGLSQSRLSQSAAGPARGWLVERVLGAQPQDLGFRVFRNANLIEQVFTMADHGQVMGYREEDGRFAPRLKPLAPSPVREAFVASLHATAVAAAREMARAGVLEGDYEPWRAAALRVLRAFLERPEPRLARALDFVRVGDDQNEARSRPLAAPIGPGLLLRAWRVLRRGPLPGDYEAGFDWIEGSFAVSPAWMRMFLRRPAVFELLRGWRKSC